MKNIREVIHEGNGKRLVSRLRVADSFFSRLRGLIGSGPLQQGEGMLITPCQQIHTHFMRYPVDVLFLDHDGRVVYKLETLKPWRFTRHVKSARHVLEMPEGAARSIRVGDMLRLGGVQSPAS